MQPMNVLVIDGQGGGQWKKRNSIDEQHVCYILARGLNKLYRTLHDIIQFIVISELEMLDLY